MWSRLDLSIVAVSIIWASVIFAAAVVLNDTPYLGQMLPILGGGAGATIVVLGGARQAKGD